MMMQKKPGVGNGLISPIGPISQNVALPLVCTGRKSLIGISSSQLFSSSHWYSVRAICFISSSTA